MSCFSCRWVYTSVIFSKRSFWTYALLGGFGLSLFFEITQITGFYGYYNCPYRLFDVDDLLLNTSGTILGFVTAPILLALFPSRASIQAKSEQIVEQNRVYTMPQLLALMIDGFVVVFLSNLISIFTASDVISDALSTSIAMVIVLFFIPWVRNGVTPGSAILRFRYVDRQTGTATSESLFKRFIALYVPWLLFTIIRLVNDYAFSGHPDVILEPYRAWISVGMFGLSMLISFILFVHILIVLFSRGKRSFYFDEVSRTRASRK